MTCPECGARDFGSRRGLNHAVGCTLGADDTEPVTVRQPPACPRHGMERCSPDCTHPRPHDWQRNGSRIERVERDSDGVRCHGCSALCERAYCHACIAEGEHLR